LVTQCGRMRTSRSLSTTRRFDTRKLTGKWITQGRLEQLIGKDEAELAVVCRAEIVGMTLIV
jgi:hypothetical protein